MNYQQRTCELQYLGSQVLQNGGCIDSCFCADADIMLGSLLQITVDTSDRELEGIDGLGLAFQNGKSNVDEPGGRLSDSSSGPCAE